MITGLGDLHGRENTVSIDYAARDFAAGQSRDRDSGLWTEILARI